MMDLPLTSIIIPCLNEEKFISRCLDSIIAQDYPKDKMEVLVVDGGSEDNTMEILENYARRYSFINVLHNPKRVAPAAQNIGIKESKGSVIAILDAHATYQNTYLSKCIEFMNQYNADVVGGAMVTHPQRDTLLGKAIVFALTNRFGVGGSVFRIGTKKPIWVNTVFASCYRKEVFKKVGLFNENIIFSYDMEYGVRLKRKKEKTLLHPEISSHYYARSDFVHFCKHNLRNGVWVILPLKYTRIPISFRHLVPLFFVISLLSLSVLSFFSLFFELIFLFMGGAYLVCNLYFSIDIMRKHQKIAYLFLMPIIFATLHITYGLGSICGLIKYVFWKVSTNKKLQECGCKNMLRRLL